MASLGLDLPAVLAAVDRASSGAREAFAGAAAD
jgi:hypothetical protein